MCRKEQTLQINEDVQVHTFNLWIQPFLVEANKFATGKSYVFVFSNTWQNFYLLKTTSIMYKHFISEALVPIFLNMFIYTWNEQKL